MKLATVLLLAASTFLHAEEVVLYRQVFGKEGEGNGDIATVNWEQFFSGEGHQWVVGGVPGQPEDLPNVNTSQPAKSMVTGVLNCSVEPDGYCFARPAASERVAFIKVDFDPSHYKTLTFRWYSASHTEQHTIRVAVQIGSRWFASDATFQNVGGWGPFAEKALQATFDFTPQGSAWREIKVLPSNKFALAEEVLTEDLPAGPLKNFGLFCENPGGAPQTGSIVDTFEVVGVPK